MADEFQSGVCSGNWWNSSPRNGLSVGGTVPCSTTTTTLNDIGNFSGWSTEMVDMKTRSCEESVSVSDSSMGFQDSQKPQGSDSVSGGGGNSVLMDSTLQMMGFGLSPSMDWNQALLNKNGGGADNNFHSVLQDELSSRPTYLQENMIDSSQVQKCWSPRNFSGSSGDSSVVYKQLDQGLYLDQNRLKTGNNSDACTVTCQSLPTSFSMDSVPYGYQPTFFQGLLDPDLQSQQSPYENRVMNYPSQPSYGMNTNELPHSWQKFPQYHKTSPPKQQSGTNHLQFSNNTPFWNPSAMSTMSNVRPSFLPPVQNQFFAQSFEEKPNCTNYTVKSKPNEVRESASVVKKVSSEPALKRPRVETASPLPTFKVRKEKLGDRVTALQQLVSPFGKTDTASVLFEAIEYIKFLHDQVSVLSAPYMKNGAPIQPQQNAHKAKDGEGSQQDLRSRGLCLVPMSSIFPVTNETAADLWTPTFGGTYR